MTNFVFWLGVILASLIGLFIVPVFASASLPLALSAAAASVCAFTMALRGPLRARAGTASLLLFSILCANALTVPCWYLLGSRWHDLDFLVPVFSLLSKALGYGVYMNAEAMYISVGGHLIPITITWEKLGLMCWSWILISGFVAIAVLEKRRPVRAALSLAGLSVFYLVVRFATLLLIVSRHPDPLVLAPDEHSLVVDIFRDPRYQVASFLPLAFVLGSCLHWRPSALGTSALTSTLRPRTVAFAACGLALGFCTVATFRHADPGIEKAGRVLLDDSHSPNWERAAAEFDTDQYGRETVYNYAVLRSFLESYYKVNVNESEPFTSELLSAYDVLVLKTPTIAFDEAELDAIESFVTEQGGGLLLIGDHTDLMGMTTRLNPVAGRFGMKFRSDATNRLEDGALLTFEPSPFFLHPATLRMNRFPFMTSCTLDVPLDVENVMVSGNTYSDPVDYSQASFFGNVIPNLDDDFGLHVLSAARRVGKGRVLLIADGTTFSNFGIRQPGCSEFVLGAVEYLNRENGGSEAGDRMWPFLAVGALAGLLTLVLRGGIPLSLWASVLPAALLMSGLLGLAANRNALLHAYPEPDRRRPPTTVAFVTDGCDVVFPPPLVDSAEPPEKSFDTFYVWTQRLGYEPRLVDLDRAVTCDIIVMINPRADWTRRQRQMLVDYVDTGGRLLVMDTILTEGSTANQILNPLGLSTVLSFASTSNQYAAVPEARPGDNGTQLTGIADARRPLVFENVLATPVRAKVPVPTLGLQGGTFLYSTADGGVLATMKAFGGGRVVAVVDSVLFSRVVMGEQTDDPDESQLAIYEMEYQLLRDYLLGDLYEPDAGAGSLAPDLDISSMDGVVGEHAPVLARSSPEGPAEDRASLVPGLDQPIEASVKDERLRRPAEIHSGGGVLTAGQLDVEAAAEFTGSGQSGAAERADGRIGGPATHSSQAVLEEQVEDHLRFGAHPPLVIDDDHQVPAVGSEFETAGTDVPDGGAGAARVEPEVRLETEELRRQKTAERKSEPRTDDLGHERRTRGRARLDGRHGSIRLVDDGGKTGQESHQQQQHQRQRQ